MELVDGFQPLRQQKGSDTLVSKHHQNISVSAKAAIIRDSKVLVIRYDQPFIHYNLPGGRLFNGESLHEAVRRKLRMECNVDVRVGKLLWVLEHIPDPNNPKPGDYQKVQFTFEAELLPGNEPGMPPEGIDLDGQDGVEWIDLDQIRKIDLFPPVAQKLLEVLAIGGTYDPLLVEERGLNQS